MVLLIVIASITVPLLAWVLWLGWCYLIVRTTPKRAPDIIEAAGISFPFRRRARAREPRT